MIEEWRDIEGFEGVYQVSNMGGLKRIWLRGRMNVKALKPNINQDGYCSVGLYKNGRCKTMLLHRIVAQAFLPNPSCLPQVNHKDENKQNNAVDNLEWCDAKYNCNYGTWRQQDSETHKGEKNPMHGKKGENNPCFGRHHSEEARKKMSASHIGIQKGEKHPLYGKHHSEEARKKMSEAKKAYYAKLKQGADNE